MLVLEIVKWVLLNNRSAYTIFSAKDIINPTLDPEPNQPPPTPHTEQTPEPTADGEPEPAVINKPDKRTEPTIASEPEPHRKSD